MKERLDRENIEALAAEFVIFVNLHSYAFKNRQSFSTASAR